jgi:hypothetical protein
VHAFVWFGLPALRRDDAAARSGSILKLMGDGLQAIFAIAQNSDNTQAVCQAALAAARSGAPL